MLINDEWFGCGTDRPPAEKGALIEFDYNVNNNGRNVVDTSSIRVLQGAPEVTRASRNFGGGGNAKDEYWKKREERDILTQQVIQLQSSRNSAIALADVLFKNGAVKLPEAQAKKFDVMVSLVEELTARFESQAMERRSGATPEAEDEPAQEQESSDDEGIWNS